MDEDFFPRDVIQLTDCAAESIASIVKGLPALVPALVWTRSWKGTAEEKRDPRTGFHLAIYEREKLPAKAVELRGNLEIAFIKWLPVDAAEFAGRKVDRVCEMYILVSDSYSP